MIYVKLLAGAFWVACLFCDDGADGLWGLCSITAIVMADAVLCRPLVQPACFCLTKSRVCSLAKLTVMDF